MADTSPHILIVEARFYEDIADDLIKGAVAALDAAGASHDRIAVPGALEIPPAIALTRSVAHSPAPPDAPHYDGFVALGCVIRGETSHYDIVAGESARGLMDLGLARGLAIGNGILTVDTRAQALVRAGEKDKGGDAARACLALIAIKQGGATA